MGQRSIGLVKHLEELDGRHDGIVVATAVRRIEKPVSALLKAGDGILLLHLRLDVRVARFPHDDFHLGLPKHLIAEE